MQVVSSRLGTGYVKVCRQADFCGVSQLVSGERSGEEVPCLWCVGCSAVSE